MGAILGWDKDGDGRIDMDEFRKGVAALGYNAAKKEKRAGRNRQQAARRYNDRARAASM